MDGAEVDLAIGRSAEGGCDKGFLPWSKTQTPPMSSSNRPSICAWAECDDATPLAGFRQEGSTMLADGVRRIKSTLLHADRRRSWHRPMQLKRSHSLQGRWRSMGQMCCGSHRSPSSMQAHFEASLSNALCKRWPWGRPPTELRVFHGKKLGLCRRRR